MLPNVHDPPGRCRIISGATTRHGGSDRADVGPRHPDGVNHHSGRLTKAPKAIRFRHGRSLAAWGRLE